jgi:hypothetical protein
MDTIAMQVTHTSINSICDSIQNNLAPFSRNITLDGQDPNEGIASMSILSFRIESNRAKKGLSVKDTMAFVIFKGPRMLKELSIFREKIIELRGLWPNAYTVEHGSPVSNALTSSQLDDSGTSVLLQMAVETRMSARGLYESCYAASQRKPLEYVKLGIGLSKKDAI